MRLWQALSLDAATPRFLPGGVWLPAKAHGSHIVAESRIPARRGQRRPCMGLLGPVQSTSALQGYKLLEMHREPLPKQSSNKGAGCQFPYILSSTGAPCRRDNEGARVLRVPHLVGPPLDVNC